MLLLRDGRKRDFYDHVRCMCAQVGMSMHGLGEICISYYKDRLMLDRGILQCTTMRQHECCQFDDVSLSGIHSCQH